MGAFHPIGMRGCVLACLMLTLIRSGEGARAEGAGRVCALARQECELACTRQHTLGSASHVGCTVRCSTEAATCEAVAGLHAARPWLEQQMEWLRQFYDGFVGERDNPTYPLPGQPMLPDREGTEQDSPERTTHPYAL